MNESEFHHNRNWMQKRSHKQKDWTVNEIDKLKRHTFDDDSMKTLNLINLAAFNIRL